MYTNRIKIGEEEFTVDLGLYAVDDWMGREGYGLALTVYDSIGEPYDIATVSFGEVIGMKDAAYMDTVNAHALAKALLDLGVAKDTGVKKRSGVREYPLYVFDPEWLKCLNAEKLSVYHESFESLMNMDRITGAMRTVGNMCPGKVTGRE